MGETFWQHLSVADRTSVESVGVPRLLDDGRYLFRQADPSAAVYIVMSGRLKLVRTAANGREILVEIRGVGELVGELGVIDGRERSAAARAMGHVELLTIDAVKFGDLLTGEASISNAVLKSLAARMRQTVERRVQAGVGDVRYQLCGRLLELIDEPEVRTNEPVDVESPLTQQELADWLGISRDAVVIALQRLRTDGVVETGRRKIRVLDLDQLRRMASQLD